MSGKPSNKINNGNDSTELMQQKAFQECKINYEICDVLKVCMFLQTDELKNEESYLKLLPKLVDADADLVVFPEWCYFMGYEPLWKNDLTVAEELELIKSRCLDLSRELGKAVVASSWDNKHRIYSMYANAFARDGETSTRLHIKHLQTENSVFALTDYKDRAQNEQYKPIVLKGFRFGMTICFDCNVSIFSRMYSLNGGVDLIVNSTGGNVVYDKWYKYNKARAIENSCYTLVTMGGNGNIAKPRNYVFGFNPNGGEIKPENINGSSDNLNVSGGMYIYEISHSQGEAEDDYSNPFETANKLVDINIPAGEKDMIPAEAEKISDTIYHLQYGFRDVMFIIVDGMDIMKPEKVQPALYDKSLKTYKYKSYIIINKHTHIDPDFYRQKMSIVLKTISMDNYCAVVLQSNNINKCFQTSKSKTAQVVRAIDGYFGIDLSRTGGPDVRWGHKLEKDWRDNYEWLVDYANTM